MMGHINARENREVNNSSPEIMSVMSRSFFKMLFREEKLLKRRKKMNYTMETDTVGSFAKKSIHSRLHDFVLLAETKFMEEDTTQSESASTLMIGVKAFPIEKKSAFSILSQCDSRQLLNEEENQASLEALSPEELVAYIESKQKFDPFSEGQFSENKGYMNGPEGIARKPLEALISMQNSKIIEGLEGKPKVFVGISDDHTATGLEMEMARLHQTFNLDKWEHLLLRNVARTYTQSQQFERNLILTWYVWEGHLILELSLRDGFDQLTLTNPKAWTLPIRVGASIRRLQGYEMIKELYKITN